jgi:hypothetical protein
MADSLIKLSADQTNPGDVKSSSFKVKTPAEGSGEEGKNQLLTQSKAQSAPGEVTGSDFKTEQNNGETGTSLSTKCYVDFESGDHY